MLTIVISILTYSLLFSSCATNSNQCSRFYSGSFLYNSRVDSTEYFIYRKDSIQVERNKKTGLIIKSKIIWLAPCQCRISFLESNGNKDDLIINYAKDHFISVKIIKVKDDYCIYQAKVQGQGLIITDTLRILR